MSENLPMKPDDIKVGQIVKAVYLYRDGTITTITGRVHSYANDWIVIGENYSEEFRVTDDNAYVYLIQDVSAGTDLLAPVFPPHGLDATYKVSDD